MTDTELLPVRSEDLYSSATGTTSPPREDHGALRIALLSYRGTPTCGGQGVYVAALSAALSDLGHDVEVFSGEPPPDLSPGIPLHVVPGPAASEPDGLRGHIGPAAWIDRREAHLTRVGIFAEPNGFSWRAARALRREPPFDIVHDNQSLGYGLLALMRRVPVTATIHHPLTIDRRIALEHTTERIARIGVERFYKCTTMQARVARRLGRVLTVSERSRRDIITDFGMTASSIDVVPVAVDEKTFRPLRARRRVPGRIVTTASSDQVLKGLDVLIRAMGDIRMVHPAAHLVVVGTLKESSHTEGLIREMGLGGAVSFTSTVSTHDLVELYATAEVACVPSRYEGFSLPAAEAMACGVPLVSTDGGALLDVAGPDGDAALLVPAGDSRGLAERLVEVLEHPSYFRETIGSRGRQRVLDRWSWARTAEATVGHYRRVSAEWAGAT